MIGEGIYNYINEHTQKDWIAIYAEVSDISSEYSSTWRRHGSSSRASYDITYQYEVEGQKYSDMLYNQGDPMALGEKVKIKYDPMAPEKSTYILSPSISNMIVFLICGSVFATIGYFLSGTWVLIRKIRRKGQPEEEEKKENPATNGDEVLSAKQIEMIEKIKGMSKEEFDKKFAALSAIFDI